MTMTTSYSPYIAWPIPGHTRLDTYLVGYGRLWELRSTLRNWSGRALEGSRGRLSASLGAI